MSAGGARRGGVSVCLTLHIVYSTLIFIDVCMGRVGRPRGGTYEMSAGGAHGCLSPCYSAHLSKCQLQMALLIKNYFLI